jgi:hypothetical protein
MKHIFLFLIRSIFLFSFFYSHVGARNINILVSCHPGGLYHQLADARLTVAPILLDAVNEILITRRQTPTPRSSFLPGDLFYTRATTEKKETTMYFSYSPSPSRSSYNTTSPMDIPSTSSSRPQSPSCAYPSWPRRSSLDSESSSEDRNSTPSSFISDDDLEDIFPAVFDDAEQDCTPIASPYGNRSPETSSSMHQAQVVVDTGALMRELIAQEKAKKARKRRSRSSSSRKSRNETSKHMSPILEVGE